jgi:hypothetical protein
LTFEISKVEPNYRANAAFPNVRELIMVILKKRLNVLALGLALLAFASPSYAQAAGYNISAARAAATHKCSVLASKTPEHDSSTIPWYTYTTCMAEHGQRP